MSVCAQCNETKCNSHENAFFCFVKEEWIVGRKFSFYINCALRNKWLAASEYNCRFVCAVIYNESIFYPVLDDVLEEDG
ncbi:hypothetical protein T11_8655, partial [Trichinella zimbabwensis]